MEAVLVLGAGVGLANALYRSAHEKTDNFQSPEEEDMNMLEAPRAFLMHEQRERGGVAPPFNAVTTRVPWSEHNPPYNVHLAHGPGPTEMPTEQLYNLRANAYEHNRQDYAEQFFRGRQYVRRKQGSAVVTTFTREISNPDDPRMRTGFINWEWMPPNPSDSDYNDAAALSKMIPRVQELFTPDAYYMTAPGLNFRYGTSGNPG